MNKNCVAAPGEYPLNREGQNVFPLQATACASRQYQQTLPAGAKAVSAKKGAVAAKPLSAYQPKPYTLQALVFFEDKLQFSKAALRRGLIANRLLHPKFSRAFCLLTNRQTLRKRSLSKPLLSILSPGGAPSKAAKLPDADTLLQAQDQQNATSLLSAYSTEQSKVRQQQCGWQPNCIVQPPPQKHFT